MNQIYVDVFESGHSVAFTHGAVGTFGKRSLEYNSLWGCGITEGKIVFLSNFKSVEIIDELRKYPFNDYTQDVKEYLFLKNESGVFEFCCVQNFDENNIDKHNPNFFDGKKNQVN